MKYTVLWTQQAEQDLASLWLNAESRAPIGSAANEIDRLLMNDPGHAGESRPNRRRILFVAPLGISFKVERRDRVALVLRVWRTDKPPAHDQE